MSRRRSNNFVSRTRYIVDAMIERVSDEIEWIERGRPRRRRRPRSLQPLPVDAGYNVYGVHGRHLDSMRTS